MKKKSRAVSLILAAALAAGTTFSTSVFAASPSITSDTNKPFTLSTNKSYTFKLTVNGTSSAPKFAVGNGSLLKTKLKQKSGNNYYYQITAANASGSTGVYVTLTGQKAKLLCIVTVSPVSKAPAPVSKAPVSKAPVSTASTSIKAKYHGATYGCTSKSEYDYVMKEAAAVKGSSTYNTKKAAFEGAKDSFEDLTGVAYSDEWLDIVSIRACFGSGGYGTGSTGSAYNYFKGTNQMCADRAKAMEAALHCAGYDARLAWSHDHMWEQVKVDGSWYNLDGQITTSTPAGYTLVGTGYNS
jgi:hypothetical protein